ncbi:hypothetical protein ACE1ET_20325 [Saccharicrinis sp. FJH62]|uniref:hypothetical protein n=1 Tax=Saccharicrinis sp. FJH62 TaxID=3344657 RepID=UPI0035D4737B
MKKFWNWILKNLSNIFGIIGVCLTFYFGVFYVPNWIEESQNEKIINAQENLIQSVKELIYSDSISTLNEVNVLIEAKEIELKQAYPLTPKQVLVCVQESFMQDKYLPLEKRKLLIEEIEIIKSQIPPVEVENKEELNESKSKFNITSLLSILISLIGVVAGIISFYLKFRTDKEKQDEIDNQIAQSENMAFSRETGFEYEKGILNIIRKRKEIKINSDFTVPSHEFDIEFECDNQYYYVEIKYFMRSKVGLSSIERFISSVKGKEGNFWFIYNTDLTDMVKRRVEAINDFSEGRTIELIQVPNVRDFEKQLDKLLPTTRNHKT